MSTEKSPVACLAWVAEEQPQPDENWALSGGSPWPSGCLSSSPPVHPWGETECPHLLQGSVQPVPFPAPPLSGSRLPSLPPAAVPVPVGSTSQAFLSSQCGRYGLVPGYAEILTTLGMVVAEGRNQHAEDIARNSTPTLSAQPGLWLTCCHILHQALPDPFCSLRLSSPTLLPPRFPLVQNADITPAREGPPPTQCCCHLLPTSPQRKRAGPKPPPIRTMLMS